MNIRIATILIAGAVFTAGLMMGFGGYVFAGDPVPGLEINIEQIPGGSVSAKSYDSLLTNKTVGQVRMEVGNVLLGYGFGGEYINQVTEALEGGGIYEAELKHFLLAIGMNEQDTQNILLEFDKLGIGEDIPQSAIGTVKEVNPPKTSDASAPGAGGAVPSPSAGTLKDILPSGISPSKLAEPVPAVTTPTSLTNTTEVKNIELMQNTIRKIQERLKSCDNIDVCDIVERHAKGRADVTDTTKKAIENRNWEEAIRLLHEVRGVVVGDIELLEGAGDKGSIADVLGLERALLHQTDSALKEFNDDKDAVQGYGKVIIDHTASEIARFNDDAVNLIKNLKAAESKERREDIRKKLQANHETLQKSAETLHQNLRANAKDLRDNFRENMKTTIGHVDHGKTGRIALAHGKGLRMVNRYRSAITRFDHILGRMEPRIEKIGIEGEARAKGKVKWTNPPENLVILIEEAKNTQTLNKAKLAELEATYESLLEGRNLGEGNPWIGDIASARAIAKELKAEIEKLHGLLNDIKQTTVDYNSSRSNVKF